MTDTIVVHGDRPKLETYQRLNDLTTLVDLDRAIAAQVRLFTSACCSLHELVMYMLDLRGEQTAGEMCFIVCLCKADGAFVDAGVHQL